MEIVQSLITIVVFVVILGGLVLVHEIGHFVTARLAGVRVLEFGIGFPPRAKVLRRGGETLYTLNWLPIGGFVKLEGEDGDDTQDPRSFSRARLPVKLTILVAGVLMNLVVAFLIFFLVAWVATPVMGVEIAEVEAGSPAEQAGIVVGDDLVAVDGAGFELFGPSILEGLRSRVGEQVTITVRHADGTTTDVVAQLRPQSEIDAQHGALGIRANRQVHAGGYVGRPVLEALDLGQQQTTRALGLILGGLASLGSQIVTNPTAPPDAVGPIGIGFQLGTVIWGLGPVFTLMFAGILSANLALVNFLPFPPLDGGRMVVILLKSAVGNAISVRAERLTYLVGFALLFAFLIWITAFDIARVGGAIQ